MRNFLRSIFATVVVAPLAIGGAFPIDAFAAAKARGGNFDGSWSVVINTARGDCGSGLRYAVRIVGGRVGGEGGYSVAGAVAPNGAIRVMVAEQGSIEVAEIYAARGRPAIRSTVCSASYRSRTSRLSVSLSTNWRIIS